MTKRGLKSRAARQPLEMTDAARAATYIVVARNERGENVETAIAGEHPLTIYLDKREIVTLMTLGQAPEALAVGYLRNQRLVRTVDDIASVQVDWETAACAITARAPIADLELRLQRRTVTTGCGQGTVFGDLMDEIDRVRLSSDARIDANGLYALLDAVRLRETVYKHTNPRLRASAGTSTVRSPPVTLDKTRTPFFPSTPIASNTRGEKPVASNIRSKGPYLAEASARELLRVLT